VLDTFVSVERALRRYADALQPRSSSVLAGSGSRGGGDRFPFPAALLDDLEIRHELRARMALLEREQALVLVRWYVEGSTPTAIAGDMGRSLRHVYRMRSTGIDHIVNLGRLDEFADADVSEFAG
jgi:hypothetical protein